MRPPNAVTWVCSRADSAETCVLRPLHFPPVGIVLFAQTFLQRAEVFFALVLSPGSRVRHLSLEFLRVAVEVLAHRLGHLFGQPLRVLFNGSQLLGHLLAESFQRLDNVLLDHCLGGSQHLRRLLLGLLQDLGTQVVTQTHPQFLFHLGRNMRQRYVELAALGIALSQLFLKRHHFRMQGLYELSDDGTHVVLGQLRMALLGYDLESGRTGLGLVTSRRHLPRGLRVV